MKSNTIFRSINETLIQNNFSQNDAEIYTKYLFENLVSIIQPQYKEEPMRMIVLNSPFSGGGSSIKPGNIKFKIYDFICSISQGVLSGVGIAKEPLLAPLAVLAILISIRDLINNCTVQLTNNEAITLYTMFIYCEKLRKTINENDLLKNINSICKKYEQTELSLQEIQFAISNLEKIKTITLISKDKMIWQINEIITINFK